jgi:rhodanese-related sulfurtransferase
MNKSFFFLILYVAAALFPRMSWAQGIATASPETQNLPAPLRDTLRNIPAAGGSCRKEDYAANSTAVVSRKRSADPSCAITLAHLSSSLGKPETVLVDIRQKMAFDKNHIDGAINLGTSEVRTKHYLLNKFVVLVGDGKTDQDLYELCSELKGAGFKQTRVLRGGMLAWVLENKPVTGAVPSLLDFAGLNPSELFQRSKSKDDLVIGLSGGRKLADVVPMERNLSSDSVAALKGILQKRKKTNKFHNVILVADERFDKDQLLELAKATKPQPLLIYADSEAAYRQFLRLQNAMWTKQAKGPTQPRCGAL